MRTPPASPLAANEAATSPSPRTPSSTPSQLLTAEQVAERWQVPKAHVYRLARHGQIPTVKLGRYRRFRLVEVEAFEASGGVAADG